MITGTAGGLRLTAPSGDKTRPTSDRVKESLFSALGPSSIADAAVLDLYAGCGSLGIEALSRGAASATFVERDPLAVASIERNLAATHLADRAQVVRTDADNWVGTAIAPHQAPYGAPYDLVFVDPPYVVPDLQLSRLLERLMGRQWLSRGATVVIERSSRQPGSPFPADWKTTWRRVLGDTLIVVALTPQISTQQN